MAQLNNKAGQFAKRSSLGRFHRQWWIAFIVVLVLGMVAGFFVRLDWTGRAFLVFLAAMGSILLLMRPVEKLLTTWGTERIRYMRGGQAEALVAWLLKDELDSSWWVFNNLQLDQFSDLDHIAVGPTGLWCISTKSYRGLFSLGADGQFLHNNKPSNLLGVTKAQAMNLRDRLAALLGADVPFINVVLALPFGFVEVSNPCQQVWVVHQEDLMATIVSGRKRLDSRQIRRIVDALEMLARSAKAMYRDPEPVAIPKETKPQEPAAANPQQN